MPEAERIAIQLDLIWTGEYNGMANGDFGEASVAAVKSFQRNIAGKETGILNPDERLRLARAAKTSQSGSAGRCRRPDHRRADRPADQARAATAPD